MFLRRACCVFLQPPLLIGNKTDLEDMRVVSKQEAMEVARKHNMLYVETSARINEEVEYAFEVLTTEILATPELLELNMSKVPWSSSNDIVRVGQECTENIGNYTRRKKCC